MISAIEAKSNVIKYKQAEARRRERAEAYLENFICPIVSRLSSLGGYEARITVDTDISEEHIICMLKENGFEVSFSNDARILTIDWRIYA